MRSLYLHIGMPKTGSTSIEAAFHGGRKLLRRHGVDYLDMGQNHNKVMWIAANGASKSLKGDLLDIVGVGKNDRSYDPSIVTDELSRHFAAPQADKLVVSGQGLVNFEPEEVERLKAFVAPFFETVRVIVYVREPGGWASSRAQENVKRGHVIAELAASVRDMPERSPIIPRYRRGIEPYIAAFGRDNVDIRPFEKARFVDSDLIADFCGAVGLDPEVARELPRDWKNRGVSAEALLLIQSHYDIVEERLRAASPERRDRTKTRFRGYRPTNRYRNPPDNYAFREAIRGISGTRFALPQEVTTEIWHQAAEDISWLREVTGDATLFADAYPPREAAEPRWSTETLREIAAVLANGGVPRKRTTGGLAGYLRSIFF